jgi:hypothetical protein
MKPAAGPTDAGDASPGTVDAPTGTVEAPSGAGSTGSVEDPTDPASAAVTEPPASSTDGAAATSETVATPDAVSTTDPATVPGVAVDADTVPDQAAASAASAKRPADDSADADATTVTDGSAAMSRDPLTATMVDGPGRPAPPSVASSSPEAPASAAAASAPGAPASAAMPPDTRAAPPDPDTRVEADAARPVVERGPLPGGPADATTPARAYPVRAQAKVVAPGPETGEAARRKRLILLVAVLVVAVLGIGFVVTRNSGGDAPDGNRAGTGTEAASQPADTPSTPTQGGATSAPAAPPPPPPSAAQPTVGANPGGQRPPLPEGWRDHVDQTGFSVYVPANWQVSREGTMVYFRGDGRVLGIDQTNDPRPDPVADWRNQAATRVRRGDFPNYQEIHIVAVPYFQKAADWEFTYGSGQRTHVNNRGVVVGPKKAYGFWWQTSDAQWQAARGDLDLVFASFRPAPSALG